MKKEKTILVVDDEADLREMIQYQLESKGFNVKTAVDGVDALEKLDNIKPDLIILDMNMPRMGGVEFYSQICDSDEKPRYPVFILTARANMEQLFKNIDVDGFMAKPFEIDQLFQSVNRILQERNEKDNQEGTTINYGKQVFIVDDNPETLSKIACKFLESGFIVGTAKSGKSALMRIPSQVPDFALIKLELNDQRGDKIIFELKRNEKISTVKFVLFTEKSSDDLMLTDHFRKKSGISAFIESINPGQLIKAVEKEMLV